MACFRRLRSLMALSNECKLCWHKERTQRCPVSTLALPLRGASSSPLSFARCCCLHPLPFSVVLASTFATSRCGYCLTHTQVKRNLRILHNKTAAKPQHGRWQEKSCKKGEHNQQRRPEESSSNVITTPKQEEKQAAFFQQHHLFSSHLSNGREGGHSTPPKKERRERRREETSTTSQNEGGKFQGRREKAAPAK